MNGSLTRRFGPLPSFFRHHAVLARRLREGDRALCSALRWTSDLQEHLFV